MGHVENAVDLYDNAQVTIYQGLVEYYARYGYKRGVTFKLLYTAYLSRSGKTDLTSDAKTVCKWFYQDARDAIFKHAGGALRPPLNDLVSAARSIRTARQASERKLLEATGRILGASREMKVAADIVDKADVVRQAGRALAAAADWQTATRNYLANPEDRHARRAYAEAATSFVKSTGDIAKKVPVVGGVLGGILNTVAGIPKMFERTLSRYIDRTDDYSRRAERGSVYGR